jgi:hypothetical protein
MISTPFFHESNPMANLLKLDGEANSDKSQLMRMEFRSEHRLANAQLHKHPSPDE